MLSNTISWRPICSKRIHCQMCFEATQTERV